jgi:hypothetical protein
MTGLAPATSGNNEATLFYGACFYITKIKEPVSEFCRKGSTLMRQTARQYEKFSTNLSV